MTSRPTGHLRSSVHRRRRRRALAASGGLLAALLLALSVRGDNSPQVLPFSQNWTNIGLITANDDWSGVPGIIGYRGDLLAVGTGVNPQTVLSPGVDPGDTPAGVVDVNANQTNP